MCVRERQGERAMQAKLCVCVRERDACQDVCV